MRILSLLVLISSPFFSPIEGFSGGSGWVPSLGSQHSTSSSRNLPSQTKSQPLKSTYDDFEDLPSQNESTSSSSEDIYASLRARQAYLTSYGTSTSSNNRNTFDAGLKSSTSNGANDADSEIVENWKNAQCSSTIRLSLNDWIRRLAIDTYPLAVAGSANGNIYLADLERGEELDCISNVHVAQIIDQGDDASEVVREAMQKLFGLYDGGGVLAVAMKKDIVVSAGREGGVQIFSIGGEETSFYKGSRGGSARATKLHLEREGPLNGLEETLVTSLAFDEDGVLWVGGFDGIIRGYEYNDRDTPLSQQLEPIHEIKVGSEILSLSVNNDIGCGVAATSCGKVILFSTEDGEGIAQWKPFGKGTGKRKREFARSAIIVQNDVESKNGKDGAVWSVVCGGSEGTMFQNRLNIDKMGYIVDRKPFLSDETLRGRLRPSHSSQVVCLASPSPGLLISGSQDGTMRIWDCSYYRNHGDDIVILSQEMDDDEEEEAYYDDVGGDDRRPRCLYALTGYKVWLGSIFTNGMKLVSDGADNTVVVHDFSGEEDSSEGFTFEDDDLEDLSFD